MATIKSYTDLEQSRKLAEIRPIESADMSWNVFVDGTARILPIDDWDLVKNGSGNVKFYPAWSLAALLSVLPFPVLYMEMVAGMILWCCECHFMETDEVIKIEHYDNPIDACYEMIIKLNKFKML